MIKLTGNIHFLKFILFDAWFPFKYVVSSNLSLHISGPSSQVNEVHALTLSINELKFEISHYEHVYIEILFLTSCLTKIKKILKYHQRNVHCLCYIFITVYYSWHVKFLKKTGLELVRNLPAGFLF